jgi:hypothetical protein
MKKDTLIMILLPVIMISLATRGIAQQPEFTKVYYDGAGSVQAYAIVKTSSNDLLVAGYCDNKPYAMMLDPQGNILWANSYGSDNGNIFSIAPTNDGDFILAGNMTPSGSTQDDILLIRITPGGDTVWSKTADLGFIDKAMFVMQTSDNGFLLTGYSRNSAVPHYKSFVMRLDSTVSLSWVKTFYTGSYYNYLYSAAENQDGSFLLAGSAGNGNLISGGALLMKLTSSGDVIWSKKQGVTFPNSSSGNDLKIFPDGIIWYLTDTNSQMALLKTDLSGNFLWCKSYDVTGAYSADLPSAKLHITPDGGFIFVNGSINLYYPMGTMVKVDSDGNGTWSKNIYLISADVVRSDDNGYVVAGNGPLMGVDMSQPQTPQVGLIKFDSAGNTLGCADNMTIYTTSQTLPLNTVSLTTGTAGVITAYHPLVTAVSLGTDSSCVAVIGVVAEQRDACPLIVIPNPSDGIFRLDLHSTENERISSIRIFNRMGSQVFESDTRENQELAFNLEFLPTGIYEILAFAGSHSYARKMMIIR